MLQQPQQIPPKPIEQPQEKLSPNPVKFLELGLLELIFVGVIMIVIFGILNFFNIIRLGNMFPQMSFLPHLQSKQAAIFQITPTPFMYNVTAHDIALRNFLQQTVSNSLLPKVASASADPFVYLQNTNIFSALWNATPEGTTAASVNAEGKLFTQQNTDRIQTFQVTLSAPALLTLPNSSPEQVASQAASALFQNIPNGNWSCKGNYPISCKLQARDMSGNRIYLMSVMNSSRTNKSSIVSVIACFLPKESTLPLKEFMCPQ